MIDVPKWKARRIRMTAAEAERRYGLPPGTLYSPLTARCTAAGKRLAFYLFAGVALYLAVVFTIARLRHPGWTETELFLQTIDLALWRTR